MKNLTKKVQRRLHSGDLLPKCFNATNTVFIHIPKNAGQSVGRALYGYTIHHATAAEISQDHPDFYTKAFSFAVVRDPVSRFKSAYSYLLEGGRIGEDQKTFEKYLKGKSLDEFISFLETTDFDDIHALFHFHTQTSFVTHQHNPLKIIVDRIYKMDELNILMRDFKNLSPLAPILDEIPMVNASKSKKLDLTPQQTARLEKIYSEDYNNFF